MKIAVTGSHGVGKTTIVDILLDLLNQKEEEMKIGVTGSHSTGKTTLSKLLAGKSEGEYKFIPEAPMQAFEAGFTMNEETSIISELWIIAKQAEMEMKAGDKFIADKCFIDLLAYAEYLFSEERALLDVLKKIAREAIDNYDLVIYLPAGEFPIEDDGFRSLDPKFQKDIDELIVRIMETWGVKYYEVKGTKKKRYDRVCELMGKPHLKDLYKGED